ncbi:MAG: BMP family ABC transporter substrate-binding protein [Erysipelotrichaceae bacterium]|nr:BMP family ABC transporter substrate-binding protein [Erysipelotrichaceae bacterium]
MKKVFALLMVVAMMFVVACSGASVEQAATAVEAAASQVAETVESAASEAAAPAAEPAAKSDFKVGVVLVGDENEGYTYSHIEGIKEAIAELGLTEEANVIWKYSIPESELCYDACVDCIEQGCTLVFTNSYGHQTYAQQVAEEYPDIQVCAMTGDTARASGLDNFHNAFTNIYEARYVAGVVAGLKLQELIDAGKVTDKNMAGDNIKIGYVGAFPYAEVVSGYTAFYLGLKSIVPNVVMDVQYTNSWFDITGEKEAALALIDRGCIIIGQHADSTGAPKACEDMLNAGTTVYSVGYNVDMLAVAPNAALTSPTNLWSKFYAYAIGAVMNGGNFDTNWAKGYSDDAVKITPLGASCAAGTQEKVDEVIAAIKDGSLHVFDTSTFTVGGAPVTSAFATDTDGDWVNDADEAVFDGYFHESYFQSAPAFSLRIDGITELN